MNRPPGRLGGRFALAICGSPFRRVVEQSLYAASVDQLDAEPLAGFETSIGDSALDRIPGDAKESVGLVDTVGEARGRRHVVNIFSLSASASWPEFCAYVSSLFRSQ